MVGARGQVRRVAMLSVHTSPLDQPGSGDAGGMNVYIVEVARRLAERGVEVEVFTRATSATSPPSIQLAPGVLVRHVNAGPYEGLGKSDLPGQLCAFTAGVMAAVASAPERWYDVVHSHYWLSGQVGWLAADRWRVPLVHTMHTMARVKNAGRSALESAEPGLREIGEEQVVQAADLLVANTEAEATDLVRLYHADPERVRVVWPGVDLDVFTPGDQATAREQLRLPQDAELVLFVGRLQAHKAPDLLLRAVAELVARRPASRIQLAVLGGQSGAASYSPRTLHRLAAELGIDDRVHLGPPQTRADLVRWYRAADLVAVPSRTESFGLVAAEAQACGTPVVAGRVGGLPTVVADSGVLVPGHEPARWAEAIDGLLRDGLRRDLLSRKAIARARGFGWDRTADRLLGVYQEAAGRRAAVDQRVAG